MSDYEKIYIETEGGVIYTLFNVKKNSKVIDLKRRIKNETLINIPLCRQEITISGGGFESLKNTRRLETYPISNETILKVY